MTKPSMIVRFETRPLKIGEGWQVVANYPDGQKENITGFKTEIEAADWIDSDSCVDWVKARGYL